MPKVKTVQKTVHAKNNNASIEYEVWVNGAGLFYMKNLTPKIMDELQRLKIDTKHKGYASTRRRSLTHFASSSMNETMDMVYDAVRQILSTKVVSEDYVIIYKLESHCRAYELPDGELIPTTSHHYHQCRSDLTENLNVQREIQGNRTEAGANKGPYSLGLYARVIKRKVTEDMMGNRNESTEALDMEFKKENEPAVWINNLVWLTPESGYGFHSNEKGASLSEMPYSIEAAQFFKDMFIGIIEASQKMNALMNDKALLTKAIESKTKLLSA